MFIKNIIISGFRSYREQVFREDLSPKHNVIVGRNGSGKSNFFAAVQFVLSEKFANLREEDRRKILHEGSGRPALAAFVEIVFDNSDGRIVIPGRPDESEIRIRRTVGLKQDEFRVNDRKFTATELRQLLESAGFSASNPYYIVEQGKIANLASMKETDRYQLIKDVAGTKVYESRRKESEELLAESSTRVVKVDEAIKQLEDRLAVLEAETSELRSFQEADRKRKALEFCVYNQDLSSAKDELEKLDSEWNRRMATTQSSRNTNQTKETDVRNEERLLKDCQQQLTRLEAERKSLEKERKELVSKRALAQLRVDDSFSSASREAQEMRDLKEKEKECTRGLEKTTKDRDAKQKALTTQNAQSENAQASLAKMESALEILQAKRGRKNQFKSKQERDAWIKAEVQRNTSLIESNKQEIKRLDADNDRIDTELKQVTQLAQERLKSNAQTEASLTSHDGERGKLFAQRDKLNAERRKLWAQIQDIETSVRRLTADYDSAKQQADRSSRLDIRQGIASLEESLVEIGDKKLSAAVHGQLIDLLTVDPGFETAVDVTAGNALFNVVVDSFDVSTRLLKHMNDKKKPGRVTFFPLDTCKSLPKDIPTTSTYSSLLSHVHYDRRFNSVFAEILGKTAVAQTLETGAMIVKELDVDAVTVEGDQFSRKGGITGGHFERRTTRIGARQQVVLVNEKLQKEKDAQAKLVQQVATIEQHVTATLQQIEQFNSQEAFSRSNAESSRLDARYHEDRCHRLRQLKEQNCKTKASLQKTSDSLSSTIRALQDEAMTDFRTALTEAEESELERLQGEVSTARGNAATLQSKALQLATEFELLQGQLHHFETNLTAVVDRLAVLSRTAKVDPTLAKEVAALDEEIKVLDERIAIAEQELEKAANERKTREDNIATLRTQLVHVSKQQQDEKDDMERSHNQRVLLLQRKEDAQSKIRKLGVIPTESERYSSFSMGKLMHLLKGTHEELKKYAHVNKKAVDQYSSLVETRNELVQQKEGLQKELNSINELMTHLEQKKNEAIERTYKQVQYNFEKVFGELVQSQGAAGELQLVKNSDAKGDKEADPYSAVRVKVTFGVGSAVSELAQLSGGQKSLVALALIFAIQRCDPAPFYLFDEIDAALDAEYRTAVANVIKRQSDSCQFITATFKTEMLEVSDKVLGILFKNKVSKIEPITLEEGRALLRLAAMDERDRKRNREDEGQQ